MSVRIDARSGQMKYAAVAVLSALSAVVQAQSSVTVFGILDLGVRQVKNGDQSVSSVSNGGLSTSRIGFRGVEDLGDGLSASFWLESGIRADTGTNVDTTRFFDRRSTVSLLGSLGELRVGRDKVPTYTLVEEFSAFGVSGVGSVDKFFSTLGTAVDTNKRADNMVQYFLPSKSSGFYGGLAAAPGEGTAGKKYFGARAGYAAHAADVTLAYGQTTVNPTASGDDKFEFVAAGAAYDFQVVKVLGSYTEQKFANLKLDVANIGVLIPLGGGTVRVNYVHADSKGPSIDQNDADQFAIGYVYDLSKRTALYGTYSRVNNKGNANFVVDGNPALSSPNPGKDSAGYEVGIRHKF